MTYVSFRSAVLHFAVEALADNGIVPFGPLKKMSRYE